MVLGVMGVVKTPLEDMLYRLWCDQPCFQHDLNHLVSDGPKVTSGMVYFAGMGVYILDVARFQDHSRPLLGECNM